MTAGSDTSQSGKCGRWNWHTRTSIRTKETLMILSLLLLSWLVIYVSFYNERTLSYDAMQNGNEIKTDNNVTQSFKYKREPRVTFTARKHVAINLNCPFSIA